MPRLALSFVKTIGENKASPFLEGCAEAGFTGRGLRPCIDHSATVAGILGPERYQPPVQFFQVIFTVPPDDGDYFLGGRYIVVGGYLDICYVDGKVRLQFFKPSESYESSAHSYLLVYLVER
jgi:hypothetical protein